MSPVIIFIYFYLIILNYILAVRVKRSVHVEFFSYVFIIFLMGFNTDCADYKDYLYFYEEQDYPITFEIGYTYLADFFSSVGVSFPVFRFFCFLFSSFILLMSIKKIVNNYHLFLFFYLSFSVILDTVQFRNTIGSSFLFASIVTLTSNKKFFSLVLFLLSVLFHYSFIVFLPMFFYNKIIGLFYGRMKIPSCILVIISLLIGVSGFLVDSFSLIVSQYVSEAKTAYVAPKMLSLLYLLFPYITYYVISHMFNYFMRIKHTNRIIIVYYKLILCICILLIFYSPILIFSRDFLRVYKDVTWEIAVCVTLFLLYRKYFCKMILYKRIVMASFILYLLWIVIGQYWPGYKEILLGNLLA